MRLVLITNSLQPSCNQILGIFLDSRRLTQLQGRREELGKRSVRAATKWEKSPTRRSNLFRRVLWPVGKRNRKTLQLAEQGRIWKAAAFPKRFENGLKWSRFTDLRLRQQRMRLKKQSQRALVKHLGPDCKKWWWQCHLRLPWSLAARQMQIIILLRQRVCDVWFELALTSIQLTKRNGLSHTAPSIELIISSDSTIHPNLKPNDFLTVKCFWLF